MSLIKQIEVAGITYDIKDAYSHYITKDADDLTYYTKTASLPAVALSGRYEDLIGKPTIPASTTGSFAISVTTGPNISTTTTYTAYSSNTGTTSLNIDLSPYARTDSMPIATKTIAGCVKIDPDYALTFNASSALTGQALTYSQYTAGNSGLIVSKGTLNNVINYYLTTGNVVVDADYHHTDNNYTTTEKTKLAGIAAGAQVNPILVAGNNITLSTSGNNITINAIDTTYSSLPAVDGGTDVSLVSTGEKYTWNNKSDFSGSYLDLTNLPSIPSELNDLDFTNILGYDPNETQILKHTQGVLTWETVSSSI